MDEELDKINQQGLSIVISARNEERTLPMTICALMEDLHSSGITKWEIVLMDNASTDETSRFFAWKAVEKGNHWKYQYSPRGLVYEGRLRIFFDPVCSNVGARTKGVGWARYENIIFSDAHMGLRKGTIFSMLQTLNEFGGIIHPPVSWMGSSPDNPSPGYQYSYKIGEKGPYGTWNRIKVSDQPFYIPLCGHCFMALKKKDFQDKGGYPLAQRVYGGGEPYLDSLYWMTGSSSMCDPNALVYHLSAGRSYSWHSNDLLHNSMLVSYVLGGEKYIDLVLITYMNKIGGLSPTLELLYNEAKAEGEPLKKWLDENKIMTFEEMLGLDKENDCTKCMKRRHPEPHVMRPWDKLNEEKYGYHRSYVTNFALRREGEKIFIGNTEIFVPSAKEIAKKYV